ncbi:MAG: tRNA dihydrouridine synthase DusB [Clostridiales bacterium]|nr:tRNA dihydrouridine synthase DusB [Clostridiales bacterium]
MKKHLHPICIGNVVVPWNIALAPMAGTSSCVYRTIAHEFGSALGVTELVSARGIRFKESVEISMRYLEIDPAHEGTTAIQLFGFDPEDFTYAIPYILEDPRLSDVALIDINMGCPVSKVVKTGSGSALMKDPKQAEKIIRATVKACEPYGKPVTVKFRSGWDEASVNAPDFAKMCVEAGASGLALHARTQTQLYRGKADWEVLARTKDAISDTDVPLWGNGDVKDGASAISMLDETGVEGVMVGRAAQGNPWIFREIYSALSGRTKEADEASAFGAVSIEERCDVIRRHLSGLCRQLGESTGVKEMRAQIAYYLRGIRGAAEIKNRIMTANTCDEVGALLSELKSSEH